jgi:hypothetical protein
MKKSTLRWNVAKLCTNIKKGTVNFDFAIQRHPCWDRERKSLLIHSLIYGYAIPSMYAKKCENGYDMLDGRQRCETISEYVRDKFPLSKNTKPVHIDENDFNIAGLRFSNLPDSVKNEINAYPIEIECYDEITDDEIAEFFYRLNNGKPLSLFEQTRVKAKSFDVIRELGEHELFTKILQNKRGYTNEEIVAQTWIINNEETPSFVAGAMRKKLISLDITMDQADEIQTIFNVLNTIYECLADINTRLITRIFTKTHLVSLTPTIREYLLKEKVSLNSFLEWLNYFFGGEQTTISEAYNMASQSGSTKPENIVKRRDIMLNDAEIFFSLT